MEDKFVRVLIAQCSRNFSRIENLSKSSSCQITLVQLNEIFIVSTSYKEWTTGPQMSYVSALVRCRRIVARDGSALKYNGISNDNANSK